MIQHFSMRKKPNPNKSREVLNREYKKALLTYLAENLNEIRKIFEVELQKPGQKDRDIACEEIIKDLFINTYQSFKNGEKHFMEPSLGYQRSLITIANLVELAGKNDRDGFEKEIQHLPIGQSNTGTNISANALWCAYCILGDEARCQFKDLFLKYYCEVCMLDEPTKNILLLFEDPLNSFDNLKKLQEYNLSKETQRTK